jgi:hypothetical protein
MLTAFELSDRLPRHERAVRLATAELAAHFTPDVVPTRVGLPPMALQMTGQPQDVPADQVEAWIQSLQQVAAGAAGQRAVPFDREPPVVIDQSDGLDVVGLRSLLALRGLERHPLALVQGLEAASHDRRVVDEDVLAPVVRRDESEALLAVEPLHNAFSHDFPPLSCPVLGRSIH